MRKIIECGKIKKKEEEEAIMDNDLDRSARIEMISLGYYIVLLYLIELEEYAKNKKEKFQKTSKCGGNTTHLILLDKKWCSKYLSFCISLVMILKDPKEADLCIMILQVCHGNVTYEKFGKSVYNVILANFIEKEIVSRCL